MKKRNLIIYWIATGWLALGMVSTGIVQLLGVKEEVQAIAVLGYPAYLLTLLGVLKLMGVAVMLLPRLALLKEWAYAGFFFAMSGAIYSHLAVGQSGTDMLPALLLLVLTGLSWSTRPASRKAGSQFSVAGSSAIEHNHRY
ncbi:DoxX-like family protein [Pedobacter yulinensis]|uniref:DoxX-like family protein n=1 Tax=Pedobacter yulinensis TaxID=2126353 RepID=A0A2T3HJF0_9SPHI|nr:DoxX family protein [Pedobacter yulinensis]PST82576.1 DoxX-like family protein [Pedobacter yulinensis]